MFFKWLKISVRRDYVSMKHNTVALPYCTQNPHGKCLIKRQEYNTPIYNFTDERTQLGYSILIPYTPS